MSLKYGQRCAVGDLLNWSAHEPLNRARDVQFVIL